MLKLNPALRTTELDAIGSTICRIYSVSEQVHEDVLLKKVMNHLEDLSKQMNLSIKQDKVLSTLDDADVVRDEALRKFGKLLDGYASFPFEDKKNAAELILTVFSKYRSTLFTASYATESSLIKSMMTDLLEPSIVSACSSLEGVPETILAIQNAEENFLKANDVYIEFKATKTETASSLKKPLVKLINDQLVSYLNAVVLIEPETYLQFAQQIEAEINRANSNVSRKSSETKKTDL